MSTNQPPDAQRPEGSYVEPQDPWAGGYEPGVASVPTDPIPQPYEPFGGYQGGDAWSHQTVPHGAGPYAYTGGQPRRSKTAMVLTVGLLALVLGGGGGYAAWYITTQRTTVTPDPTAGPATETPVPSTTEPAAYDPAQAKEGDCVVNKGTAAAPEIDGAPCDTPDSYKIIRIATGADIPENDQGRFDGPTTSVAVCEGTGYQTWYGYQHAHDDAKDLFFCMINNEG